MLKKPVYNVDYVTLTGCSFQESTDTTKRIGSHDVVKVFHSSSFSKLLPSLNNKKQELLPHMVLLSALIKLY